MSEDYNTLKAQKDEIQQKQNADLVRTAVLAEREQCCKDECIGCLNGVRMIVLTEKDEFFRVRFFHVYDPPVGNLACDASRIRERAAKGEGV